jgi:Short C-terminal domain
MFGDKHRLREHLGQHGKRADAEVLEVKERPWANKRAGEVGAAGVFRLKLRVDPADTPAFEAAITDEWRTQEQHVREPSIGMTVTVLYDPNDHDKVVLTLPRSIAGTLGRPITMGGSNAIGEDPELAALAGLDEADGEAGSSSEAATSSGSQSRLDRLQQLGDLHDRGVLSGDEFAAEKAKILSES